MIGGNTELDPGPEAESAAEQLGLSRTQGVILAAYVELIEELGTDDVSFRLIARRAGVGERTVFRQYGTRSELLAAAVSWIARAVFPRPEHSSVFDIPLVVRRRMEAYDRRPELAHVIAEAMMHESGDFESLSGSERLDELVRNEMPAVGRQERLHVVAALSHLESAVTWVALRREFGMDVHDIADAAAWSAEAVLNPLRAKVAA